MLTILRGRKRSIIKLIVVLALVLLPIGCNRPIDIFDFYTIQFAGRLYAGSAMEHREDINNSLESPEYAGVTFDDDRWTLICGEFNTSDDVDYFQMSNIPESRNFILKAFIFPAINDNAPDAPDWWSLVSTNDWKNPDREMEVDIIEIDSEGVHHNLGLFSNGEPVNISESTKSVVIGISCDGKYGMNTEYWLCFQEQQI